MWAPCSWGLPGVQVWVRVREGLGLGRMAVKKSRERKEALSGSLAAAGVESRGGRRLETRRPGGCRPSTRWWGAG